MKAEEHQRKPKQASGYQTQWERRETTILRDLSHRVLEAAAHPKYAERKRLWTLHNSLERTRPLVLMSCGRYAAYEYELIRHECSDPVFRDVEFQLRHKLFIDWIDDDAVIKPWVMVKAVSGDPGWGVQGVNMHGPEGAVGDAYQLASEPAITPADDIQKNLRIPRHTIDETATRARVDMVREAIGDILPVIEDRTTPHTTFLADLSYTLGGFLGIERLMMHMCDDPEWLQELLAFLRDGILSVHAEAEAAGDFTAISQHNQAECYARGVVPPSTSEEPLTRRQLWGFFASQEYTSVSPAMHEEFLFRYQLPIMEKFGLVAYGCCEDLSLKIDMLRQLKNLRRIAVSPFADLASCARQIGEDYVISWRPNPAQMVCNDFNPERVGKALRTGLDACAGCHVDITLKDVQTVHGDPMRLKNWALLAKEIAGKF